MPNSKGNPEFKSKYGERTKVTRLPESVADAVTALLKSGVDSVTLIKNLPFVPAIERASFPEVAAIYFVYVDNRLLYIGKAANLKKRFTGHHRFKQFSDLNAKVAWFAIDDPERLPEIENSLIDLLDPELNGTALSDKKIFTIRLDDATVEALERFQLPSDSSLNATLKRVIIEALGMATNTTVNNNEELQKLIRQEIENALNTIASQERFQETVHIIGNDRIQNQNNILDDHEFRLGKLEELTQETFSSTPQVLSLPVSDKSTPKPTAIAAKETNIRPTCPHCESTVSISNGKDRHGLPRYKCKNCGKTRSLLGSLLTI